MANPGKEELEAEARAAVLVRRSDLPVPLAHRARSFLGGLPRLPPEFDWPRADVAADEEKEKETVALTFIAQIDLSDLPQLDASVLPKSGTLYFFASSAFVGEPCCRVLYYHGNADALPQREPPPDLMPLGRDGGFSQVKWLDPATDLHAKVEFKYPLSFLPFRDFAFYQDPVGGELLVGSLCEALGPGEPLERDMLKWRRAEEYVKDEDWPFNWLLITHVARAALSRARAGLKPPYRKPFTDETKATLQLIEAGASRWLERSAGLAPLDGVDADTRAGFRTWWADVARKYAEMDRQLWTTPGNIPEELGEAINHTIRCMAADYEGALDRAPRSYVTNLERQNHWKTPTVKQGTYRSFDTQIHQILGYGSSCQGAPEEHRDDVLLLQLQGEEAFFDWHTNIGCVLHYWIGRDALARLDFSQVEGTFECD